MSQLPEHEHVNTILRYYEGCNTANVDLMMSTFATDVVHYFVDHEPVESAAGLAHYWAKIGPKTKAHWTVERAMATDAEAVIEWAMSWVPMGAAAPEMLYGTEWFRFRDGRITEIRSYHNNPHLANDRNSALWSFPYAERGYRTL